MTQRVEWSLRNDPKTQLQFALSVFAHVEALG